MAVPGSTAGAAPARIVPPPIAVPPFWLAKIASVEAYLQQRLQHGMRHHYGTSTLGRPLVVIEYGDPTAVPLMVIGGTHGHEPGTVAATMNLLHLLETGTDLALRPHPALLDLLQRVHLYVVPCLNPDGRAICPDSFYAQSVENCGLYACGLQHDGSLIPYDSDSDQPLYFFDPGRALFMGGQFNAAGYAMNRRRSLQESDAAEVQALLQFVRERGLQAVLDLHACGYNYGLQASEHEPPYWDVLREWQRRAERLFGAKGRPLGRLHGDGDPPRPPSFHYNAALFHRQAALLFFMYEGRQGYLGRPSFMPLPSSWEIVDDYLTAVQVFLQLGLEGAYAQANRQVFG